MANFYQVFKNEPICKYVTAYCEHDGDVEAVCGKCKHGKLFCYKCSDYKPMTRLIDADKLLINAIAINNSKEQVEWSAVSTIDILTAPTVDAVPVVRCRDCAVPHNKYTGCPELNGLVTPPDFYCPFGERKDGAD